jgi:hypothetical protein
MSRARLLAALCLAVLAGCSLVTPPDNSPAPAAAPDHRVQTYRALRDWLDLEQRVAAMEADEVVAELVKLRKPVRPRELFYFGLLNQKLKTQASWVQARDAFREVSLEPAITREQRQLAAILTQYNQSRINWHAEYQSVQADFAALQEDLQAEREKNTLLEQKIQAITDLETSISTRKEQEQVQTQEQGQTQEPAQEQGP